jgi:tetratricopeptide (TPR) repeat protein
MMMKNRGITFIFSLLLIAIFAQVLCAQEQQPTPTGDEAELAELKAAIQYVPSERIERLRAFISAHPNSTLKVRAQELIASARAAWGDERLTARDTAGGLEQFRLAVAEAPEAMTEKFYTEVLVKIPSYLFLKGLGGGAMEIARLIEEKVKTDAKRLLLLTNFYTSIEDGQEAARISEVAVRLAPDMAAAHQALALSRHISLQIEAAATEYQRALELDPKLVTVKRSLANLRRAQGRFDEALKLYRELITEDPADKFARAGIVLALLETGSRENAERELDAALKDDPRNLQLLTGAAYWYAAHNDNTRALDYAQRAVDVEPRYVWAQVALARALIADKKPLAAEQALRVARRFGRFPTLDYELANALYAAGLYTEAATELARSFTLRGGQIETQLAGRNPAKSASFIELLAPERMASIFQSKAADTEANARSLRALLAFNTAMGEAGKRATLREQEAVQAAQEFAAGDDAMRSFRQLYVAERLLRAGVVSQAVLDMAEAAASGIDAAVDAPAASVATLSEELYSARLQAITSEATPPVPDLDRTTRSNILRGRVEEVAGWTLYNQDKASAAVERLRRATSLLPENSVWWRTSLWHLGAALEANGNEEEALNSYLRSYDKNTPDEGRRTIIEKLYRKLNGSLAGLDAKLGTNASASSSATPSTGAQQTGAQVKTGDAQPSDSTASVAKNDEAKTESPTPTAQPDASATSQPAQTTATPVQTPATDGNAATEAKAEASNPPQASATPEPSSEATASRARRKQNDAACSFSINEETITIKSNGGTGIITVRLSGSDKITPTTRDWPDITVFGQTTKEYGSFPFLITSISKRPGRYTVTFTTPCGSKDVTVIVK